MDKRAEHARINGKKGGRPKGTLNKKTLEQKEAQAIYRQMVFAKLEPIIEAQLAIALGYTKFERTSKGRVKGYWTPPNGGAIEDVLSRAIGKSDGLKEAGEGLKEIGEAFRKILSAKK